MNGSTDSNSRQAVFSRPRAAHYPAGSAQRCSQIAGDLQEGLGQLQGRLGQLDECLGLGLLRR